MTVFSVATRFLSFLFKIYISRTLGAEAIGLYQMALSVYLLTFSFAASGLPVVLSRKIAEDTATDSGKGESYLSASLIITLICSFAIIILFYSLKSLLPAIFADSRAVPILLIMLPTLLSTALYASLRSWFWGKRNFNAFCFFEMLEEIFRIVFTVILTTGIITVISPLNGLALGFLLSDVACVCVIVIMFFRYGGRFKKPEGYRMLIRAGLPVTSMKIFGGLMAALTALVIPAMLVAGGVTTSEATAAFGRVSGMAMPLLMAPTTITGSLAVVLIPEIATASAKNEHESLRAKIEGSILFSIFIASFFCILFMPLGKEITEIVFKDSESGIYLANSAILLYPIGVNQISLSLLNSLGMEKKSFINYLLGTLTLLIAIFVLPKFVGIYAVAIGTGVCFTITSILNLRLLNKREPLFSEIKKPLLTLVFMPPCVLLTYLLKFLLLPVLPKFIAVVLSGGIPMAVYLALTIAFKIIDISKFYHKGKRKKPSLNFW